MELSILKFRNIPITLSLEDFKNICNIPFIERDYDQINLEDNEFNFDTFAHTLLMIHLLESHPHPLLGSYALTVD